MLGGASVCRPGGTGGRGIVTVGPLRRWLGLLGLDEIRCSCCLRPFSPSVTEMSGGDGSLPLCPECGKLLTPFTGPRCPLCGFPFPAGAAASVGGATPPCGACLARRPPWRALAYHGVYKGALRDLVLRFKFGGELALGRLLAGWLENAALCLPAPDVLVGMPQHPAHLRRRGFNQAHELARALHAATHIPFRPDILVRRCDSAPQSSLNAQLRAATVRGVFGVAAPVSGMRIWLVDDVMTTGSTLREAAQTLLGSGAAEVCALVIGRTPRVIA